MTAFILLMHKIIVTLISIVKSVAKTTFSEKHCKIEMANLRQSVLTDLSLLRAMAGVKLTEHLAQGCTRVKLSICNVGKYSNIRGQTHFTTIFYILFLLLK